LKSPYKNLIKSILINTPEVQILGI